MKIRVVAHKGHAVAPEAQENFLPPPCICPDPWCKHCNPSSPPFCPLLIDYPVAD